MATTGRRVRSGYTWDIMIMDLGTPRSIFPRQYLLCWWLPHSPLFTKVLEIVFISVNSN